MLPVRNSRHPRKLLPQPAMEQGAAAAVEPKVMVERVVVNVVVKAIKGGRKETEDLRATARAKAQTPPSQPHQVLLLPAIVKMEARKPTRIFKEQL